MKLSSLFLSFLLVSQLANAGVLTIENGNRTIEGVNVGKSADMITTAEVQKLDSIGAGLRTKHVLITNVKVYVAQIFLDNAGKFVRTSSEAAVASLADMKSGAIHLTFLRNVDAATVQVSFRDALEANGVDVTNKGVADFLSAVNEGADAQSGKAMNISLSKEVDGTVKVVYENTKGEEKSVIGDSTLFTAIFSIWIGKSADSGLATLKAALLKGDN